MSVYAACACVLLSEGLALLALLALLLLVTLLLVCVSLVLVSRRSRSCSRMRPPRAGLEFWQEGHWCVCSASEPETSYVVVYFRLSVPLKPACVYEAREAVIEVEEGATPPLVRDREFVVPGFEFVLPYECAASYDDPERR